MGLKPRVKAYVRIEISDDEVVGSVRGKTLNQYSVYKFSCNKTDKAFDKPSYV